jgi:phage-related protein
MSSSAPVVAPLPTPEGMRTQLRASYELLASLGLNLHARDFWRIRAAKQKTQVRENALLHEHTAIQQYVQWHGPDGSRLPADQRGTARSIARARHA